MSNSRLGVTFSEVSIQSYAVEIKSRWDVSAAVPVAVEQTPTTFGECHYRIAVGTVTV